MIALHSSLHGVFVECSLGPGHSPGADLVAGAWQERESVTGEPQIRSGDSGRGGPDDNGGQIRTPCLSWAGGGGQ